MTNSVLGGTIVIGIADDGEIVGVDNVNEIIEQFRIAANNYINPIIPLKLK